MNNLSRDIHELLRCRSLQELIETAHHFLVNPLILTDLTGHVLAMTTDGTINDPRWLQIAQERTVPQNLIHTMQFQTSLRTERPIIAVDSTGLEVVCCAISQEERLIGYLMLPCYNSSPAQEHLDLLQVVADLCALRMEKDLHYGEYPENLLEFFISDLLNGTITDEDRILDRCRYFHWNLKMPFRVMTIRPKYENDQEAGGDYLLLDRHRDALSRLLPEAKVFLYGNHIKLIAPVYDQSTKDSMILHDLREICLGRELLAGVSQASWHLRNLSARHQQAMKALDLGRLLGGEGPLFRYDTYSVYHCLELCAPQINLLELCHSAVLTLELYDRKNGTELLGTLHAYLAKHRNLSDAAASLFIHRNTLSKRLDKINDLVRVDLDDAEVVFHLMFSYRIIEYYGVTVLRDSYESWVEKAPTLKHP